MMPETIKYYIFSFIITFLLFGVFIVLLAALYSKRQVANKNEKLKLQSQFSETLLQTRLEIQEQILRHVSQEIHDNLSHTASIIKINLNTIRADDSAGLMNKIEFTKELVRQLLTDLKSMSVSLSSDHVEQSGLAAALGHEAERIKKSGPFQVIFINEGNMPFLSPDKVIILYRMAQEVLNNMLKHSQAQHAQILLRTTEKFITLALSDDGVGFDINDKQRKGGAGLINLTYRAGMINARLTMQSSPGNGSVVSIELPL